VRQNAQVVQAFMVAGSPGAIPSRFLKIEHIKNVRNYLQVVARRFIQLRCCCVLTCATNRSPSFTSTDHDNDRIIVAHVAAPHGARVCAPFGNATKKFKGRFEFLSLPFAVSRRCGHRATRSSS
jgi:hypothetical protein